MSQTLHVTTTDLMEEYKRLSKDDSADNVATGKLRMQHYYTFLSSEANNYAIEKTRYGVTKANQRSYLMPPDYFKMKNVRIKSGDVWHPVTEVKSIDKWHQITSYAQSANIPTHYIIMNDDGNVHIEFNPIPDTNGDSNDPNIEFIFEGYLDPITFPTNYDTGTVTVANGDADISGASTVWTASMVGRFINVGKWWYEIASVTNNTSLSLVNYYQEASASSQSYTIAEVLRLPPEFSYTPLWGALADYWVNANKALHETYEGRYVRELLMLQKKYKSKSKGAVSPGIPVGVRRVGSRRYNNPFKKVNI